MNEEKQPEGNGQAAQELESLLTEWRRTLPKEFTLGTVGNGRSGHRRYPDLHFTADEAIPGLYYADLDAQALSTNGSGQKNGIEFKQDNGKTNTQNPSTK